LRSRECNFVRIDGSDDSTDRWDGSLAGREQAFVYKSGATAGLIAAWNCDCSSLVFEGSIPTHPIKGKSRCMRSSRA